jgi:hypothetical protein
LEVSEVGHNSNENQEARKKMNNGAGVKRIKP